MNVQIIPSKKCDIHFNRFDVYDFESNERLLKQVERYVAIEFIDKYYTEKHVKCLLRD